MGTVCLPSCTSPTQGKDRVIILQPFQDISPELMSTVWKEIKAIHPSTIIRPAIPLPTIAFNPVRGRYRADTLIHYLNDFCKGDSVIIGLTSKDISTTKGKVADWGVMGLGYCPGKACVVSTFRLSKTNLKEQLFKVAVHELGHTQGLPHCPNKTCFMRDAKGGNPLNEEKGFCTSCSSYLSSKSKITFVNKPSS